MRNFRIFLASPGDVGAERQVVREVIEQLRNERRFQDTVALKVVAWDLPGVGVAMEAGMTPQEAIEKGLKKPEQCDLVVVIFWTRIGTPLPAKYKKPDGTGYRSGTEWEFLNALNGFRKHGVPSVWVYRRSEPFAVPFGHPDFENAHAQWQKLESFFGSFSAEDGSIEMGINSYWRPEDFRSTFAEHLRTKLEAYIQQGTQASLGAIDPSRRKQVERLLREFFYPISNRLKKDSAIWEGIKRDRDAPESLEYKMAYELEMKQVIPNHREMVGVIEKSRHLVEGDEDLTRALDQYLRHVATFIALRDAGESWKYPELVGHPWPKELIPLVEQRLKSLESERDSIPPVLTQGAVEAPGEKLR